MREEAGAGTALAVAVVATVVLAFCLAAGLAAALDARHRAGAAADAAALAAADTALGVVPGVPCDAALVVAAAQDAVIESCEQRGALVRVRASVPLAGLPVAVTAVAGPPGSASSGARSGDGGP